jgi:hypothetical protein
MMVCEGWTRCIEWRDQLSCEKSRFIYLYMILIVYEKRGAVLHMRMIDLGVVIRVDIVVVARALICDLFT